MTKRMTRRTLAILLAVVVLPGWILIGAYQGLGLFMKRFKQVWEDA